MFLDLFIRRRQCRVLFAVVVVVVAVVVVADQSMDEQWLLLLLLLLLLLFGSADELMDEQKINREIMTNAQQQSLTTAIVIPC